MRVLCICGLPAIIGRLATYRYYNPDQVIDMALAEFDRIFKLS
jgi:UDP-galactopyranose mutase